MYKFFTSKKGFTIIELVVVLLLLSFGVLALANMFKVTYRAFSKSEERYIKQEAVKYCAEALHNGSTDVVTAEVADIYNNTDVVPPGNVSIITESGEEIRICLQNPIKMKKVTWMDIIFVCWNRV